MCIVGRGAGTGLSGGAIPRQGGVMVGFARMNRILEIDLEQPIKRLLPLHFLLQKRQAES